MSNKFHKKEYDKWIQSYKSLNHTKEFIVDVEYISINFYIEKKDKDNFLIFYHDPYDNLPLKGWQHYCYVCQNITSKEYFYSIYMNKNIYINKCTECKITKINTKILDYRISQISGNNIFL